MQTTINRQMTKRDKKQLEAYYGETRKYFKNKLASLKRKALSEKDGMSDSLRKDHAELCQLCKHGKKTVAKFAEVTA